MDLFGVISWILFGLAVGAIARLLMPGRQRLGWLMTITLGVVGSFVGGALSTLLFASSDSFVRPSGWIMSILGAVVVLLAYLRTTVAED
ncbi:hypothetical protein KOR34_04280 [Posidoniimonas corsicana]|uniref:Transglycosylase associated protein n=1 Tax=Posidoniimonas corsicana TaxID=1938618 RepID=A0A5C5VD00_9BACT|nr:GlsB/YeaQ/YmgE family stress response membrane protein [Posidoniimonas corsicana]TWT35535.1 hypothetical protein KOR34_04280 [Posidoniimonas corsicana]